MEASVTGCRDKMSSSRARIFWSRNDRTRITEDHSRINIRTILETFNLVGATCRWTTLRDIIFALALSRPPHPSDARPSTSLISIKLLHGKFGPRRSSYYRQLPIERRYAGFRDDVIQIFRQIFLKPSNDPPRLSPQFLNWTRQISPTARL